MIAIAAFILTLILVVGLHEAGHAVTARLFNIRIKRISIGFGKPVLQWQGKNNIQWVWAMFPLGGFVHLLNSRIEPVTAKDYPHCFDKQPVYVRIIILLAGIAVNLITAWLALIIVYMSGIYQYPPQVQSVQSNSLSAAAGLQSGDKINAVNGYKTTSWKQVGMRMIIAMGQESVLVKAVSPKGDIRNLKLNLSQWSIKPKDRSLVESLGIKPNLKVKAQRIVADTFGGAVKEATNQLVSILYFFIMMLKQLFSGAIPFAALLGPLGMISVSIASFSEGMAVFMNFIATLSIAVALVNILPFPGLDGGSILYTVIEKIRGKPMSVALEVLLFRLAVILFCVILVNLIVNDLHRLVQG